MRIARPFYDPPSLLMRQAVSAFYYGYLIGWKQLFHWLLQYKKTLPTVSGAIGMGCIGFPIHPVWETTNACNLKCEQCHASSGKALSNELTTEESKKLIGEIASIKEFRMLALGGGEPLLRPDIFELADYAINLGLEISIATNGTLLTKDIAKKFKKMGVANIAIGLNANNKTLHENITHVPGSFEKSKRAVYATAEAGLNLQINTTVMNENREAIPELLDFASEVNAQIVLLYQMVPLGRGEVEMELSVKEYKLFTDLVAEKQIYNRAIIEPTCSPQYWAYLLSRNGRKPSRLSMKLAKAVFKGCVAGSGLCYIEPDGEVWPCPFIPISGGNVHEKSLRNIWYESEVFQSLRDRERLTGEKCGSCRYKHICGGCRGRAYSHSGDYLSDDPLCFLEYSRNTH